MIKVVCILLCVLQTALSARYDHKKYSWTRVMQNEDVPLHSCKHFAPDIRKKTFCHNYPGLINELARGFRMAMHQCEAEMSGERWDCPTTANIKDPITQMEINPFDLMLGTGTRESAFLHSIITAGGAFAVAAAEARGHLKKERIDLCSSDSGSEDNTDKKKFYLTDKYSKYGGCVSDHFYEPDSAGHIEKIHHHNARQGLKTLEETMVQHCRCHGVSGSCNVKTCWKSLSSFEAVSSATFSKFKKAKRAKSANAIDSSKYNDKLVYSEKTPSKCEKDEKFGMLSSEGRECTLTKGPNSCKKLCCKGKYETVRVKTVEKSNCKFNWCCSVECDEEEVEETKYYCI